jgi:predicted amidohydrolase YtcJ
MTDQNNKSTSTNRAFINGKILSMDDSNTVWEAIVVRDGQIVKTGNTDDIRASLTDQDALIDLGGKTMLPGFIDAHGHFPGSGLLVITANLNSPPIGKMTTIGQVIDELKAKAAQVEKGKWVVGWGYDDTLIEEKRMLDRHDLDEVSKDHPVYISHVSGHIGAANSLGLEQAGFTSDAPNPEGGVICRDSDSGEPNGILEEEATFAMSHLAMSFSSEEVVTMLQSAVDEYLSFGMTSAQSGLCDERRIVSLSMGSQIGQIPIRLMAWPDIKTSEKIIAGDLDTSSHNTDLFKIGAAKIIGDGSIQAYTAHLSQPYHVPFKGDAEYRGYPVTSREEMVSLVKKFHNAGMQIAIHGNGDATIDDIIHSFSEAQKENPREDARHIIIHCQTVREDQLDEIKRLDLTPSFFSAHAYYWGERHRSIFLGPERADRMNPAKSALDKGIRFTIHVDTPITPMRPLLLAWSAVNRLSTAGNVIGESERISPIQALRAVTIDAAWQIFQEEKIGSIESGKMADLVILAENPLENPVSMHEIEVLETIVGGETVYKK